MLDFLSVAMSSERWQFYRYRDEDGNDPVWDFIQKQMTDGEREQLAARMQMVMEKRTDIADGKIVENLNENLYALRIPNTPNNPRIFMCTLSKFRPKSLVMLHAYQKRTKKIPEAEMKEARKRLEEVRNDPKQRVFWSL